MNDKIIAIISTSEIGKARTGMMYTINALKHGWLEDAKLFIFGPAEELILKDEEIQTMLKEYQQLEETPIACKFIADRDGLSEDISGMGIQVDYVGKRISDLIKEGYTPMVW